MDFLFNIFYNRSNFFLRVKSNCSYIKLFTWRDKGALLKKSEHPKRKIWTMNWTIFTKSLTPKRNELDFSNKGELHYCSLCLLSNKLPGILNELREKRNWTCHHENMYFVLFILAADQHVCITYVSVSFSTAFFSFIPISIPLSKKNLHPMRAPAVTVRSLLNF